MITRKLFLQLRVNRDLDWNAVIRAVSEPTKTRLDTTPVPLVMRDTLQRMRHLQINQTVSFQMSSEERNCFFMHGDP